MKKTIFAFKPETAHSFPGYPRKAGQAGIGQVL
jgi:hypothetical protein